MTVKTRFSRIAFVSRLSRLGSVQSVRTSGRPDWRTRSPNRIVFGIAQPQRVGLNGQCCDVPVLPSSVVRSVPRFPLGQGFRYGVDPMSKLLLIDDEADVQYSFQRIFDSPEIELTTASSGEEGLRLLPKLKPDLVIMDVRMGGMTGLETLRRIRQIDSRLLVILMTAYGTTQTAIEAMKLGAYDYLLKPFDVPKLKEIITNALKAARDMKQVVSYQPLLESEDYELRS